VGTLFKQEDAALVSELSSGVRDNGEWLRKTLNYPLAIDPPARA